MVEGGGSSVPPWQMPPPSAPRGAARSPGRATALLAALMLGWLLVLMALAGFSGESGGAPGRIALHRGVSVQPASGWTSAPNTEPAGAGEVSLRKAGAIVVFVAEAYEGPASSLFDEQIEQIKGEFSSFRGLPPATMALGENRAAVGALFSGTLEGGQLDGELVTVCEAGTGVVVLALAPSGQLSHVQADLDEMLRSLIIP